MVRALANDLVIMREGTQAIAGKALGLPLDGAWGQAVYPKKMSEEAMKLSEIMRR